MNTEFPSARTGFNPGLVFIVLVWLCVGCSQSRVETKQLDTIRVEVGVLSIERVAPDSAALFASIEVKKPYHIQANPASEPYLIPAELDIAIAGDSLNWNVTYPVGHPFLLAGSPDTISVYDGRLHLKAKTAVNASFFSKKQTIVGHFRYQACDDKSCFPPASIPIHAEIQPRDNFIERVDSDTRYLTLPE